MRPILDKLLPFMLLTGIVIGIAFGAVPRASAQRYPVHAYMETDHLPSSNVYGLAQASDGRMWFALRTGVVWYDGAEWHACHEDEGLPPQSFGPVVASPSGAVRTLMREFPLRCYEWRDGVWTTIAKPETDRVSGAKSFREVALAAGIGDELVVVDTTSSLHRMNDGRWFDIERGEWLVVHGLAAFGDTYYVATDAGLFALETETDTVRPVDDTRLSRPLVGVTASYDGKHLWVVGPGWIGRYGEGGVEHLGSYDFDFGSRAITYAASGPHGGVYFGDATRLFYFHPGHGVESITRKNGLSGDGTSGLALDRDGTLWVASLRGVSKILGRHLAGFDSESGLPKDEVTAVLHLRSGEVVLAYEGMLTVGFSPTSEPIELGGSVNRSRVIDLEEGPDGHVWCAAMTRGLGRFDENWNVTWYLEEWSKTYPVTSVVKHQDGSIWAGTERGVFRFDGTSFERMPLTYDEETEPYARRLLATSWGTIVVGTFRQGLFEKGPAGVIHRQSGRRNGDSIYSLFEHSRGVVLVGTLEGVYRYDGDVYERSVDCTGALRRPVYSIARDHDGATWLGTDRGFRIARNGTLHELLPRDGLLGVEANRDAAAVDKNGRVWLGTDRGLTIYDRSLEPTQIQAPTLTLLDITTDAGTNPADVDVMFDHDLDDLVFRFRAISFRDETRVRFRTRLEGFEDEWREPIAYPKRQVHYPNLSPGTYRFEVQAIDAEGRSSDVVRSGLVTIRPAWWERRVTIAGLFVVLAGIAWGIAAFRLQRRYARRLESKVEARTRELDAMHAEIAKSQKLEAVGLLAGGIAHDFNNLLTGILGNLSLSQESPRDSKVAREAIDRAVAATKRARGLTQQLLTFSRGGAPVREAAGIAHLLRESVDFVLHGSRVEARVDIADDLHDVEIDVGQMAQVIQNLLLNARQAVEDGGRVTLEAFNLESDRVCIEVHDEGPGIAEENLARVFDPYFTTKPNGSGLGLAIAHSIVRHHEGRITVRSTPGAGATFRVELPATQPRERAAPAAGREPHFPIETKSARILAMDDEEFVRDVLEGMLEQLGYEVEVVENGEQAIVSYERAMGEGRCFDAVIMDLTVRGGMGGRAALAKILAIDPDVRAIVASGYSGDDVLADPDAHGFVEALPKPFVMQDLAGALDRILQERHAGT